MSEPTASRTSARIRPVAPEDRGGWGVLWEGYLSFYREDVGDRVTEHTFERLCRGEEMFGFVAEAPDGGLVGIAHGLLHPSTWSTRSYCYLEDLFVDRRARGGSIARDLIERVAGEATSRGAEKIYWHTQEFNAPARSLYDVLAQRVSFVVYERQLDPGS